MKPRMHTTLALAALATALPSQRQAVSRFGQAPADALRRAVLVERQEGDLAKAIVAYRALLRDDAAAAVHDGASLRLGALLWRLGYRQEATPLLQAVLDGDEALAIEARAVLDSDGQAAQDAQGREQQAEALVKRLAELLRPFSVTQPVDDATSARVRTLERELVWLGADAARVLVRRIQAATPLATRQSDEALQAMQPLLGQLCRLAWQVGTAPAHAFLIQTAKEAPLPFQRFVTRHHRGPVAVPVLLEFLRSDDPTGELWRNTRGPVSNLSYEDALRLLGDDHLAARSAGLLCATINWQRWTPAQREALVSGHADTITDVLRAPAKRLQQPAWDLLAQSARVGPTSLTRLLLPHLHEVPDGVHMHMAPTVVSGTAFRVAADDAWIAAAAKAAAQLPRPMFSMGHVVNVPENALAQMLANHEPRWTAAATADVLQLVARGFADADAAEWYYPALERATGEQIAALIRSLPQHAQEDNVTRKLRGLSAGPAWFPAIRDVVGQCLDGDTVAWRGDVRDGRMRWSESVDRLVVLAGSTRHEEAATWLQGLARRAPALAPSCLDALLAGAQDGDAAMRGALRDALASDDEELEVPAYQRAQIFHELARAGDVGAIDVMAASYGLAKPTSPSTPRQLDVLFDRSAGDGYGYDDAQLARLWRGLLTGPAKDAVWSDLTTVTQRAKKRRDDRQYSLPRAALPAFVEALRARDGLTVDRDSELPSLLAALGTLTAEDLDGDAALQRVVHDAVTHPEAPVAMQAFLSLREEVQTRYVADAKRAFVKLPSSRQRGWAADALPLTADDWRPLLQDDSAPFVLNRIDDATVRALQPELEACLRRESVTVRAAAAQKLAHALDEDSVPLLLPLLRDPSKHVRETVAALLDELRDARMHADYWSRAKDGIDTSKVSAAAKLLAQAMPGQDQEQRVLAIRSLALLDAPETLPYLIDWTKDADTAVQEAARSAVQTIHQRKR